MIYHPLPGPGLGPDCDPSEIPEANETVPCPVCGSEEDGILVGTMGRYQMLVRDVVCRSCTLVHQSPRPDAALMAAYYSGPYRKHYGDAKYPSAGGQLVGEGEPGYQVALEAWHVNQAENAMNLVPFRSGDHVLEIGCREGRTLGILRERKGIVAHGIEPGPEQAQLARKADIDCFTGVFEEFEPGELRFDTIQLFHVLEHIHDPLAALIRLRAWLKPGGKILIEVPNVYQPYGPLEGNFFQNAHLTNFSPRTLSELLRRAGFEVSNVVDAAVLFAVAEPASIEDELPLPFDPQLMSDQEEDAEWVSQRLFQYAELQDLSDFIVHCELNAEVLERLEICVKKPCFVPHLVNTVSDLAVAFMEAGAPEPALCLVQAAMHGPHPAEILQGLGKLERNIRSAVAA